MSFTKVTAPSLTVANITALADRPALTAAALKAKFDEAGGDLLVYLTDLSGEVNDLIDELEAATAAASMGAAEVWTEDASAANVQAKLVALKAYIDGLVIAAGAGDMVKTVYDTDDDGKVDAAVDSDKLGGVAASGYALALGGQDAKATIADADAYGMIDSVDGVQKKTLFGLIKSTLQTAFALIFAPKTHAHTITDLTGVAATSHTHAYASLSGVAAATHGHLFTDLTGAAAASHTHTATSVSGFAKNAAGILITVSNSTPSNPTTNDLWFSDEA